MENNNVIVYEEDYGFNVVKLSELEEGQYYI